MVNNKYPKVILAMFISANPFLLWAQDDVEFNSSFLVGSEKDNIDVNRFAKGNPVLPGVYRVQLYVNNALVGSERIEFIDNKTNWATPCIPYTLLESLAIDVEKSEKNIPEDSTCLNLSDYFPGTEVVYNTLQLRLDITIPQIYRIRRSKGYISPSRWDNGIPALLLSYDNNYYHTKSAGSSETADSLYSGLTYGLNFGAWRLRARGSLNWDSENKDVAYQSQNIYLQRDVAWLRAQLILGESNTQGDAFDSISLHGARLFNDSRMYTATENNYAPVIRGVAKSNAKVTVKQNGFTLYQATVPPGQFALDDVTPAGFGSDLEVTVEESSGSSHSFSVPYAATAQLVRNGRVKWELAAGELNNDELIDKPQVAMGTAYYGVSDFITTYAGMQLTDMDYTSGLVGLGFNTSLGAIAGDVTWSRAKLTGADIDTQRGQSYRLTYSNILESSKTNFSIAAYRFSTREYLSLSNAASLQNNVRSENGLYNVDALREQLQISINQPLLWDNESYGAFYLSSSWQKYWGNTADTQQYSLGYSNTWNSISYGLSVQRNYDENNAKDDSIYLSFTVPLGSGESGQTASGGFTTLTGGVSTASDGSSHVNTNANGSASDGKWNYSVNAMSGMGSENAVSTLGTYATYNSSFGPLNSSASLVDDGGYQFSFGGSGGLILHSGGLTLAPNSIGTDDAIALVQALGAEGAQLTSGRGEIGQRGYAVVPYLYAYHENRVGLSIDHLKNDIELKNTNATVVPTNGSVVRVEFETDQGRSLLLVLKRNDDGFIPLGAEVFDSQGRAVGYTGQAGYAWIRGVENQETLNVVWGNAADQHCYVDLNVPELPAKTTKTTTLDGLICRLAALPNKAIPVSVQGGGK